MVSLYIHLEKLSEICAIKMRRGFLINVYNVAMKTSKTANAQRLPWMFSWSGVEKLGSEGLG